MDEHEFELTEYKEFNSPEKVFTDEYTLILEAFENVVLTPFLTLNKKIDRHAIALTREDLEWKLSKSNFKDLSFKLKDVYQRFKKLVDTLGKTTDEEITQHKNVLLGLSYLMTNCVKYGRFIGWSHTLRDYCREQKYRANSIIRTAEENLNGELLEAEKGMSDVCIKCPYK